MEIEDIAYLDDDRPIMSSELVGGSEDCLASPSKAMEVKKGPVLVSPEKETSDDEEEEEKKEEEADGVWASPPRTKNRVSSTAKIFDNHNATLNSFSSIVSPESHKRTQNTGLSELSKQLRVLQANNQYLQSEMERCQRQLKIMSESKGVSVVDMMKSLESACAGEAHAELQSQITSLQAQLEGLKMSGNGGSPGRNGSAVAKSHALQQDSLKQEVASLQLQLGEYEELEQKLKEEMKGLYDKNSGYQTKALTLEATCEQQKRQLEAEKARNASLEAQLADLKKERNTLKGQQTLQMNQYWQETMDNQKPDIDDEKKLDEPDIMASQSHFNYTRSVLPKIPSIQRSLSHNDLMVTEPDAKADVTSYFKPSTLPSKTLQRSKSVSSLEVSGPNVKATVTKCFESSRLPHYLVSNDTEDKTVVGTDVHSTPIPSFVPSRLPRTGLERSLSVPSLPTDPDVRASITTPFIPSELNSDFRSQFFVHQTTKTMNLETLCRHQQQTLQQLQEEQSREIARLEQERNAAQAKRNLYEQKMFSLELDLRLEKEKCESLRSQLACREEEFSLKKDQLQSRLQVHQERTVDLEGQLSSLYVAFELLQQDRSEEHMEQAELRSRLIDADSRVAQEIQERPPAGSMSRQMRRQERQQQAVAQSSVPQASPNSAGAGQQSRRPSLRERILSPQGSSGRNIFGRTNSGSQELPASPPIVSSTGSDIPPLPPSPHPSPASTVYKGYLLKQQSKKKSFLGGDKSLAWKQKYFVLKQGQGSRTKGSYCFWYGDAPLAKVKGTIPHLIQGVSTATFGADPEHPLRFVIHVNPRDPNAPVVNFEALSAEDLSTWENVLKDALDVEYNELTPEEKRRADLQIALAIGKKYAT